MPTRCWKASEQCLDL